jgi:hypothetical protein
MFFSRKNTFPFCLAFFPLGRISLKKFYLGWFCFKWTYHKNLLPLISSTLGLHLAADSSPSPFGFCVEVAHVLHILPPTRKELIATSKDRSDFLKEHSVGSWEDRLDLPVRVGWPSTRWIFLSENCQRRLITAMQAGRMAQPRLKGWDCLWQIADPFHKQTKTYFRWSEGLFKLIFLHQLFIRLF